MIRSISSLTQYPIYSTSTSQDAFDLFQNWSSHMINIQSTKFERKSIVTFVSDELPWSSRYYITYFIYLVIYLFAQI